MPETITGRDAARFPIIASCTLFGLYLFFKVTRGFLSRPPGASCRRLDGTVMKASTTLTLMCFDAGIFSRVHQPAAVGLLLRPGRAGSVSHYEVKRRTDGCVVKYNRFTDVVVMFTFFLFLSLSPLMSRIFPESFPNKQYQLLFTQGSGESKEGESCCNTPVFTKRSKDPCVIM